MEKPIQSECGLFAIFNPNIPEQNYNTMLESLHELQHRGQDAFGISYLTKNNEIKTDKYLKMVYDNIQTDEMIKNKNIYSQNLSPYMIGHLRYKTSGKSDYGTPNTYVQPLESINFSMAHNGNIKNTNLLHDTLIKYCSPDTNLLEELKQRNHDSFYIKTIIELLPGNIEDKLIKFMDIVPGVYCLLILTNDAIYAVRDRYAVRPLSIASVASKESTGTLYISSESCAFPANSVLIRNVNAGEIVKINPSGITSIHQSQSYKKHCLFEYIYYLRPSTISDGNLVGDIRTKYGQHLATKELRIKESYPYLNVDMNIHIKTPIKIDTNTLVVGSPFSGVISGKGYALAMGLEYDQVICKTKNIRSFILDNDTARKNACYQKFGFNVDKIKNKNIVLVDDSLVRGHTIRIMIEVLKELGAKDIHVRIASPPIKHPCYFGVDIPTEKELIANNTPFDKIVDVIGATSLMYLCMEDVKKIHGDTMCHACFTGEYTNELLEW